MDNNETLPSSIHTFPPGIQLDFAHNYTIRQISDEEYKTCVLTDLYSGSATWKNQPNYKSAHYICDPIGNDPFVFTLVKEESAERTSYPAGIISTSNPNILLLIQDGDGTFLNVQETADCCEAAIYPILSVYALPSKGLLIIHNFTELIAYRASESIWATERILRDGLTISKIDTEWIYGFGEDTKYPNETQFGPDNFKINIESGKYFGGGTYNLKNSNRIGDLEK